MAGSIIRLAGGMVVVPLHLWGPLQWRCVVLESGSPYFHKGDTHVLYQTPVLEAGEVIQL